MKRERQLVYSVVERFWRRVLLAEAVHEGCCWNWQGSITSKGYGLIHLTRDGRSTSMRAHRCAYELLVGPIPDGLQLDHLCRNRACVNPWHLEPVTASENVHRGDTGIRNRSKTHCLHGHPLAGKNLVLYEGRRVCRACKNRRLRELRHRRRAAVPETSKERESFAA